MKKGLIYMSFSTEIKNELCSLKLSRVENISFLSGFVRNTKLENVDKISLFTENPKIVRYLYILFKEIYGVSPLIEKGKSNNFNKNIYYNLIINENVNFILKDIMVIDDNALVLRNIKSLLEADYEVSLATSGQKGALRGLSRIEHHRLVLHLVRRKVVCKCLHGTCARLHADGGAVEYFRRRDFQTLRDDKSLPVIVVNCSEHNAQTRITRQRPCCVSCQNIHFPGLQGCKALRRRKRDKLDFGCVAQDGCRRCTACIDIQACPATLRVCCRKARSCRIHTANHLTASLHRIQNRTGLHVARGARQNQSTGKSTKLHDKIL